MAEDRFTKKRHSLVGGGLARFEGAEAADEFARRQSSHRTRVRQSIPDIRFDETGMPISTRQLQARSHSLAGGSGGSLLQARSHSLAGGSLLHGYRPRGSEHLPTPGAEKNVRKLSKKFSTEDEEELKANFTLPASSRAGMLGTNRRWNVKPDWMKKRKSSLKEEFIEKNLSNLELLSPTSPKEGDDDITSISEELVPPSGEKRNSSSDRGCHVDDGSGDASSSGSGYETDSSGSDNEDGASSSDEHDSRDRNEAQDDNADVTDNGDGREGEKHHEDGEETVIMENTSGRKLSTKKKRRKSKRSKKSTSEGSDKIPPRPPPPPLPIQMCDVSDFFEGSSSSDEEDVIRTQYGKQKMYVSELYHVFENSNGPLLNGEL